MENTEGIKNLSAKRKYFSSIRCPCTVSGSAVWKKCLRISRDFELFTAARVRTSNCDLVGQIYFLSLSLSLGPSRVRVNKSKNTSSPYLCSGQFILQRCSRAKLLPMCLDVRPSNSTRTFRIRASTAPTTETPTLYVFPTANCSSLSYGDLRDEQDSETAGNSFTRLLSFLRFLVSNFFYSPINVRRRVAFDKLSRTRRINQARSEGLARKRKRKLYSITFPNRKLFQIVQKIIFTFSFH